MRVIGHVPVIFGLVLVLHAIARLSGQVQEIILQDNFPGNVVDTTKWHIPTWVSPTDGSYVGRTQFMCTQNAGLPVISGAGVNIIVQTYNPTGSSFYGHDLINNLALMPGPQGLLITFVATLGASVPGGTVSGFFLYGLKPNGTLHDEIDFELLSNDTTHFSTNIYGNEPLGAGHPIAYPYAIGSATNPHTYQIQWYTNRVIWSVDGVVVRAVTTQSPIPQGPMYLHLNMWVPDRLFSTAYNTNLNYTTVASDNQIYTTYVRSVDVQRIQVPMLTSINVAPVTVLLNTGKTQALTAVTLDQGGNPFNATVTWSSDNPSAATVDPVTGLVTAIGAGTANITASNGSIISNDSVVTVKSTVANSYGIQITQVPHVGENGDALGIVTGMGPSDYPNYGIAVIIEVGGVWWTKPYFNAPMTSIKPDGTWIAAITTGGDDKSAATVNAYLVPRNFSIPILSGSRTIPASLASFPSASAPRTPSSSSSSSSGGGGGAPSWCYFALLAIVAARRVHLVNRFPRAGKR